MDFGPRMLWWTLAKLRPRLLKEGLALPPRSILTAEIVRAQDNWPEIARHGEGLAHCVLSPLLKRKDEFADPKVLLADLLEWHTPLRAKQLAGLEYQDYLQTWYWQALSSYVIVVAGHCQGCLRSFQQCAESIQVHHLNYKHKGNELHHLDCLKVVCDTCHTKEHSTQGQDRRLA